MNFDDEVEEPRHLRVRVFAGGYDSPQLVFFRNGIEILDRLIPTNTFFHPTPTKLIYQSIFTNYLQRTSVLMLGIAAIFLGGSHFEATNIASFVMIRRSLQNNHLKENGTTKVCILQIP